MAVLISVFKKDDPFNVWMRAAAPIAIAVLFPLVILLQQFKTSLYGETTAAPAADMVANEEASDPGVGRLVVESKAVVKFVYYELAKADPSGRATQRPFGTPGNQSAGTPHIPAVKAQKALKELDTIAVSRTDRFRTSIVAGELLGPEVAHQRLEALRHDVTADGALAAEIGWLSPWYEKAAAGVLAPLPEDVQAALTGRHGWFAKLAISHQRAAGDPLRWEVVQGAPGVITFEVINGLWTRATFLLDIILAIVTFSKIRGFQPAMVETDVERSVYAETFAIFLLGFLLLLGMDIFVIGQTGTWSVFLGEALIWSASAACLWPLLRGVTFQELRIDLGWTRGQGIAKEVGAGLLGYLAGLPLHALYHFILGLFQNAGGSGADEGIKYPLFPTPMSSSWGIVLIGALSACLWAPVFEETFCRGALHRYLPSRLGIRGRVMITAMIFGAIHPYGPAGIIDVTLAGLIFGLLREWRGSLIAPMVAHFLNNATIEVSDTVPVYLLH